jgi:hypothetical protein
VTPFTGFALAGQGRMNYLYPAPGGGDAMEKFQSTLVAGAAVVGAASLFYHLVVYVPMTHEQDMRRAEQVRVAERSRAGERDLARVRCRSAARKAYESGRDAACVEAAVAGKRSHEHCVQDALLSDDPTRRAGCDAALARHVEQCLVPPQSVTLLEAAYERTEAECLQRTNL